MAQNKGPVFILIGDVTTNNGSTMSQTFGASAAADYTGISANYVLVYTADATNGSYLERLRFKANSTNIATVARIFFNNGAAQGTATNNAFYGEVSLPATTATNTAATVEIDYPVNVFLPPGFRVFVGIATAVANGWVCMGIGGEY